MADVAGSLLTSATPGSGKPDKRKAGYYSTTTLPLGSAKPDKRKLGTVLNLGSGGGGPATVHHYKLRARDNGAGPPAVYREWESTDYTSSPPPPAPIGAWVEKTILAHWTT
jgi:hypothetical protein